MKDSLEKKRIYYGFGFLLLVLFVCGIVLHQVVSENEISISTISKEVVAAVFLVVSAIYLVSALLWQNICRRFAIHRSWIEVFVDTGLMAVCKYFPGKVLGVLSRGVLKSSTVAVDKKSVLVSLLEQVFVLAVGGLLFAALLVMSSRQYDVLLTICFSILMLVIFVFIFSFLINHLVLNDHSRPPNFLNSLLFTGLQTIGYIILWCLTALPVVILIYDEMSLTSLELLSLAGAFIGAMIAGWLALFAPGGVGVREGVFVVLAPSFLSWQEGLYWITVHRALLTVFDLIFGLLAMVIAGHRIRSKRVTC